MPAQPPLGQFLVTFPGQHDALSGGAALGKHHHITFSCPNGPRGHVGIDRIACMITILILWPAAHGVHGVCLLLSLPGDLSQVDDGGAIAIVADRTHRDLDQTRKPFIG